MYTLIFVSFLGLSGLAGVGIFQMSKVFTAADFASVNVVPSLIALGESNVEFGTVRSKMWQYLAAKDPALRAKLGEDMNNGNAKAIGYLDQYEKENVANDKDKAMLVDDRSALAAFESMRKKVVALANQSKEDEAREYLLSTLDIGAKVVSSFKAHSDYNVSLARQAEAEATTILGRAHWQAVIIALAVIAAVAGMGLVITRRLVKSLGDAVAIAQTIAGGDLTPRIEVASKDEIGQLMQALKDMNISLAKIVGEVRSGTDAMGTASSEIASGNLDLSSRTEQQASSLEETASAMEQLTSTVKQNADNARQATQMAVSASQTAIKGGSVVSEVIATMSSINDSSNRIVDIISVIDGIAFQTNILALNAAVEAARAGEQGRGFAVVASEVRSLAQRSAAAAKEIKTLITDSVEKVGQGSKLVGQAGATMEEVVNNVKRVTDIVSEISAASQEQSTGIEEVNRAITQMDEVTQQNAALVEEAAAASQSLQDQASKLSKVVSVFKLSATQLDRPTAHPMQPAPHTLDITPQQARLPQRPVAKIGGGA
jgi:methyl-accepting chemotaxis protein